MPTSTLSRAEVLAESTRRYRRRFGERLQTMYALRKDPFEPEEPDEYVYLVVLLNGFEPFATSAALAEVADDVMRTFDYEIGVFAQDAPATSDDELATLAREEGVRLL